LRCAGFNRTSVELKQKIQPGSFEPGFRLDLIEPAWN